VNKEKFGKKKNRIIENEGYITSNKKEIEKKKYNK